MDLAHVELLIPYLVHMHTQIIDIYLSISRCTVVFCFSFFKQFTFHLIKHVIMLHFRKPSNISNGL